MKDELYYCNLALAGGKIVITTIIILFCIGMLYMWLGKKEFEEKALILLQGIILVMAGTFITRILFDLWLPC